MGSLTGAPAVVLVALTLSAVLLLVEVALPTFGVAGLTSLALAAVAFVTAGNQEQPWWPLLLVGAAVCLWAVLVAAQVASPSYQLLAAAMFAAGSIGYGLAARDPATVALGAVGSVAVPFSFRPLLRAASRLRDLPPLVGMDALVGRAGTIVRWRDEAGTVLVDGSLWNASGDLRAPAGTPVVVSGYTGMTVHVALCAPVS